MSYYKLTGEMERRVIHELRTFWSYSHKYPDLPQNIQGKYRMDERPYCGMVVRVSGGDPVTVSADNYMGTVNSYLSLARVPKFSGSFLEWVREDSRAIQDNNGRFPSVPGVYFLQIDSYDEQTGEGTFYVDPLLVVRKYGPTVTRTLGVDYFTLPNTPVSGSLRVYEIPSGTLLEEGVDYVATGTPDEYMMMDLLPDGIKISVDYRYAGPTTGPHPLVASQATVNAIPGAVLAFGSEIQKDDAMSVIVYEHRQPAYRVYGGKWDIQIELEIIAADKQAQMDITDRTAMFIQGVLKTRLSDEGIELMSLSIGSQSEEIRDEAGDDYFFNNSMSFSFQTDWEIHQPLVFTIRDFDTSGVFLYGGNYGSGYNPAEGIELNPFQDPFFYTSIKKTYEMIT
jgi:hypothetical protein